MDIKVEIDQSELRKLLKNIDKYGQHIKRQVQNEIVYTAQEIRTESQMRVPVDTSRLKKSAYVNMKRNRLGAEIGYRTKYAAPVEFGSRPHVIRPKNAKVLSWKPKGGGRVFAKVVNHPGTKPRPFLMPAFERQTRLMKVEIKKIITNRKNKFRPT